jgi:hypothetical protein
MMQKLIYEAQLSQNRLLTGAATPCLPTILAEGTLEVYAVAGTFSCDAGRGSTVTAVCCLNVPAQHKQVQQ